VFNRLHSSFVLFILILTKLSFAQPNIEWARVYNDADSGMGGTGFLDLYPKTDGSYAFCGAKALNHSYTKWILITDAESGDITTTVTHSQTESDQKFLSLVEADNGDLVAVGHEAGVNGGDVAVMRISVNGNEIWRRYYGGGGSQRANAVIELKEGNFLIAGYNGRDAYLIKISPEGDVIWERNYGNHDHAGTNQFWAMRETEDGVILAGMSLNDAWLLRLDGNGDEVWSQAYGHQDEQPRVECFFSLISVPEGGFLAGGYTKVTGSQSSPFLVVRISSAGEVIWQHEYDPFRNGGENILRCAAYMTEGGFILVGQETGQAGLALRITGDGESLWSMRIGINDRQIRSWGFRGVVTDFNGGILVTGSGANNFGVSGGLLLKIAPERSAPIIIEYSPEVLIKSILLCDTLAFHIHAEDAQHDTILYCYRSEGQVVSNDSDIVIPFPDAGRYSIIGVASDGALSDSVVWFVCVNNLFIASHSPDTLSLFLRRGTSQTFSLDTVRAIEGDPVQYQWMLTNLDNFEREEIGAGASATIEFLRSGNFQMEGMVYRGESSDNVIWTIAVRSAILDFWPRELNLSVPPDSSGEFGVIPFNPESDSLSYRWEVDGDSVGSDSTVGLRFAWNGQAGRSTYAVSAIVMDGAEGDTIRWEVTVQDPNATPPTPPSIEGREVPATFGIVSVSPNPFNNSTTIRFTVPFGSESAQAAKSAVRLTVHDLTGREVARLVDSRAQQSPPSRGGPYAVTLNGKDLPAGIYLVRLQMGEAQKVAKVVLVR